MTLDEAIAKAKADGDVQLAEWLRQARGADAASRWYTEKLRDANRTIRKLLDENAKLIVKLNAEHIVRQNVEVESAKLRELCKRVLKNCYDAYEQVWGWDDDWVILCDEARELGVDA